MALAQTVQLVRAARAMGHARRRARVPRQLPPIAIERSYGAALARLVSADRVRHAFAPLMRELPGLLAAAHRHDAGEGDRARALVDAARRELETGIHTDAIARIAREFADHVSSFQRVQLNRQLRAALGVDVLLAHSPEPTTRLSNFVSENVSLIRGLPERVARQVEQIVTRGITTASLHPDLADDLEREFSFGERRSALIARDQVGKLYGQLNASRQRGLGITHFRWTTVGDERVRDEHQDLDGEVFAYDDPPAEGLPGEPILCRCYASPIFDDLQEAVEE